jgi:4-aminobutyrate aminotransferase
MTPKTMTGTVIDGPKIKTALPGPNAKRVLAGDERYISPSYTRSYPLVAKKGRGVVVTDVDGNEFFDFSSGIAVTSTGHCHPDVVAAIQKQAAELIHMSGTDFYYESLVTLAERLSKIAPMAGPHRVYYGNSGAEAVECALKLARYHTGRQQIIAFFGAFHGRTMGALSLTASKPQQKRRFAPLVPGVTHVSYPDVYRNGEQDALACARFIEGKLFKTTVAPEEVAAIFVEPVQGEGGYVAAPPVFMQELRRICDQHGILLVADEVQSGIGRTGKWWAIEHTGVQPDIVCMAKGIASGMALSVTLTKADIMNWVPGSHASTFGGNPVCIAAALATLDVIEREGLLRNSTEVGDYMRRRMADWPKEHKLVGDVRGLGLMIGVELVIDKQTKERASAERDRVVELAFERGVLFLGCGPNTVRISPPLITTKEQADVAMDVLEECIELAAK